MEKISKVVLGLGSNSGDRMAALSQAVVSLRDIIPDLCSSSFYETAPVGVNHHGPYMNAVACGSTPLGLIQLDTELKSLEVKAGRDEAARARREVPLDLDIVIYDEEIVRPRDFSQSFFQIGYQELHKADKL